MRREAQREGELERRRRMAELTKQTESILDEQQVSE